MIFYLDDRNHLLHRSFCVCATEDKRKLENDAIIWYEIKKYRGCPECCKIIPIYESTKQKLEEILQDVPHKTRYEYESGTIPQYLFIETSRYSWRISVRSGDQSFIVARRNIQDKSPHNTVEGFPRSRDLVNTFSNIRLYEIQGATDGYFLPYLSSIRSTASTQNIEYQLTGSGTEQVLYLMTKLAFWKITYSRKKQSYSLYHAPFHDSHNQRLKKNVKNAPYATYHRQTDVYHKKSPEAYIIYISEHDNAKRIIKEEGYQALPTTTNKQKRYFKQAEKKKRQNEINRTLKLLDEIGEKSKKGK